MQYQRNSASCSAAAIQNALRVFGVRVGQHKLTKIVGCCPEDGADEHDVLQALGRLGCTVDIFETDKKRYAEQWLQSMSYAGPLLLCVDDWFHWVCVAGGCNKRLWLYDPSTEPWNVAENGSWPLLPKTILKRWKAARRRKVEEGCLYYGIAILECDAVAARNCVKTTAGT